jgi:hypothetical protein
MSTIELLPDRVVIINAGGETLRLQGGAIQLSAPNRNGDIFAPGTVFDGQAIAGQFTRQHLQDAARVIPENPTNVRSPADERRRRQFLSGQACDPQPQSTGSRRRS